MTTLSLVMLLVLGYLVVERFFITEPPPSNGEPPPSNGDPDPPPAGTITVTASSHDGNLPANTLDGDLNTRWSSQGIGQWIQYEFAETRNVQTVSIAYYRGNVRRSFFTVQGSMDGVSFTNIREGTSSGTTLQLEAYQVEPMSAKFVRIVGRGNSGTLPNESNWNSITEVRFGFGGNGNGELQVFGLNA